MKPSTTTKTYKIPEKKFKELLGLSDEEKVLVLGLSHVSNKVFEIVIKTGTGDVKREMKKDVYGYNA